MTDSSYDSAAERRGNTPALAAAAVLGAALGSTKLASLDLPLALANGDRLLRHGEIPRTNVWSWVAPDYPCLNDKWGFDALVAAANAAAGDTGLQALQVIFGAAIAVLLFALCRRVADGWRAGGLAALGTTMAAYRLFLRAEWISYLFVGATLLLLPHLRAKKLRHEIAFVAIVPVAAACHGYWFLGPVVVLAAAVASGSPRTIGVGLAGLAAAAISPFGFENVLHPVRIAAQVGGTELTEAISELRAPFASGGPVTFFHALAVVLGLVCAAALVPLLRSRRWADAAVLAAIVAVSFRFDRNLAMLGLTVPLAAAAFRPRTRTALAALGVLGLVAAGGALAGSAAFLAGREPGFGWQEGLFPIRLAAELGPSGPGARYVNDLSIGSFLVRARGEAFIDGSTHGYPPEFLSEYRRALTGETGVREVDAKHPNDGWLLRHNAPTSREMILGLFLDRGYAPVHWDAVATLFVRDSDSDRSDTRWKTWLRAAYLPVADAWFPSDEECRLATKGDPDWGRRAAVLCPWRRPYYEAMVRRYAELGDIDLAAQCLRYAERFP